MAGEVVFDQTTALEAPKEVVCQEIRNFAQNAIVLDRDDRLIVEAVAGKSYIYYLIDSPPVETSSALRLIVVTGAEVVNLLRDVTHIGAALSLLPKANPFGDDLGATYRLQQLTEKINAPAQSLAQAEPILVYLLIGINILAFFATTTTAPYNWGATSYQAVVERGEYHRLVTAMFLHADFLHLAFNMFALYVSGRIVERYFGHVSFLLIYFISCLAGAIASIFLNAPNIASLGASGAIFGLFGAELAYYLRRQNEMDAAEEKTFSNSLGALVINLLNGVVFNSGSSGQIIDIWAHAGGAVGGLVTALYFVPRRVYAFAREISPATKRSRGRVRLLLIIAAPLLLLILVASVITSRTPRTLTVENVSITAPGGWQTFTDFSAEEFDEVCRSSGLTCLIALSPSDEYFVEMARLQNFLLAFSSLESLDETVWPEIQQQRPDATLISRETLEIDGRDAIKRLLREGDNRIMFIFVKYRGAFLRIYAEGTQDGFDRYEDETAQILSSIRFVEEE